MVLTVVNFRAVIDSLIVWYFSSYPLFFCKFNLDLNFLFNLNCKTLLSSRFRDEYLMNLVPFYICNFAFYPIACFCHSPMR